MTQRFAAKLLAAGLGASVSFAVMSAAEARTRTQVRQGSQHAKEAETRPVGPLTIVVSIARQHLTVYDGSRPIASTVVSTGVPGHSTPLGVFSVIQKDRFHKSNIYSNAPMPYMQRITWSGVALHEGHVTGRVASHGCIRLPQAFAIKLWGMTRMGARVIVAQDDVAVADFTTPDLLIPRPPVTFAVATEAPAEPFFPPVAAPDVTASIAPSVETESASIIAALPAATVDADATIADAGSDAILALAIDPPAAPFFPSEVTVATADPAPAEQVADATPPNLGLSAPDLPAEPSFDIAAVPASPAPSEVAVTPVDVAVADLSLPDGMALPGSAKPFRLDPKAGPISIFISKREGKLFVRQNFKPVYDTPVEIAADDAALGTHLFTAVAPASSDAPMRWTLATVPSTIALQQERERLARLAHKPAKLGVEVAARGGAIYSERIDTAAEAMKRVKISDEARDILTAAVTPGSSLIISDLGFGTETGKGTDFIVQAK